MFLSIMDHHHTEHTPISTYKTRRKITLPKIIPGRLCECWYVEQHTEVQNADMSI